MASLFFGTFSSRAIIVLTEIEIRFLSEEPIVIDEPIWTHNPKSNTDEGHYLK